MEPPTGIEPAKPDYKSGVLPLKLRWLEIGGGEGIRTPTCWVQASRAPVNTTLPKMSWLSSIACPR